VILTIVVTVILLKVDVAKLIERITEKYSKRKTTAKSNTPNPQQND
jgi:hypothetical protein